MKVPRPLRLATDVSRLLMLCPHSGSAGMRSAATTAAPAAPPPAQRALLSGPRAREDRTGSRDGEVARVGGEASLRGAPGSDPCASGRERLPGCRPPADGPATVASRNGACGGPGWRSQRRRGGRGPTPRGGVRREKRRRERARPPYVSEDGERSTPRAEGGVRWVHLLTCLFAPAWTRDTWGQRQPRPEAAQPPAWRQTPAPQALRARLRPLGRIQRSSAHRLAVSLSRPSLSQMPQDCTRARI